MTQEEACRVLGVLPGAKPDQIKKKYRQLMHRLHPDAGSSEGALHLVQQINVAYSLLKNRLPGNSFSETGEENVNAFHRRPDGHGTWSAPVNEHAYRERKILCYAEGHEGEIIGTFTIASGRYFWTIEEDFPLFLRSIYNCGKEILDEIDTSFGQGSSSSRRSRIQADLTYLLAQQYIDASSLLGKLAARVTTDREGQEIFYFPAMLETSGQNASGILTADMPLSPAGIKNHRLYLKDTTGQEIGYLSFADDRLYYVLIPLFEQRQVLVRLHTAGSGKGTFPSSRKRNAGYRRLHLWMKFKKDSSQMPESLNLQISRLLEKYKFYLTHKRHI